MQENSTSTSGSSTNGESVKEAAGQFKERVRSKAQAAGESVRERAEQARGWARSQVDGLQTRVQAEPYRATAWALGVGLVLGVAVATLLRGSRR